MNRMLQARCLAVGGAVLLAISSTACATRGSVENLEKRVSALETRVDNVDTKAQQASDKAEAAYRTAESAASRADDAARTADAIFKKSVHK